MIVSTIAALPVGLFFLIAGVRELMKWRTAVPLFVSWGYPSYWPAVTYALKIIGGALVLLPFTRLYGLALCAAISIAAILTILKHVPMSKGRTPLLLNVAILVACAISAYALLYLD